MELQGIMEKFSFAIVISLPKWYNAYIRALNPAGGSHVPDGYGIIN